jgi:hypothetical protein
MAPTKESSVSKDGTPTHFEEYGLSIPLIKRGQRKPHARLARELATESKEKLSAIVKNYLPVTNKATKLLKSLSSRTAIAEWIESAETLALGPHPKSKLACKSFALLFAHILILTAATKKEALVEALGLKTAAPKAKADKVEKDVQPRKRPGQKRASLSIKDVVVAQSVASRPQEIASSKASLVRPLAIAKELPPTPSLSSPPQTPSLIRSQTQTPPKSSFEAGDSTQKATKRKHDNAADAKEAEQMPKKRKTSIEPASPAAVPVPSKDVVSTAQTLTTEETDSYPSPTAEATTEYPESLHADKLLTTSHQQPTTYTPTSPTSNSSTPHNPPSPPPSPFLKPGRHGRHGDFTPSTDPDLLTGRGHQVPLPDLQQKRRILAFQARLYARYPHYPHTTAVETGRGTRVLVVLEPGVKAKWDKGERWMRGYRERYSGEVVGHLWDCGCEVPRDGDESEEE